MSPSRGRYPLEAAQAVREADERRAQERLAAALGALDDAREARERVAAALAALRAAKPAPSTGATHAAALQREDAFERRRRARIDARAEALRAAMRAERRARDGVTAARAELASAAVATELLERHRERWEADRRRRAERAAEEARDELARLVRRP